MKGYILAHEHFEQKRPHTAIKHKLFSDTFNAVLSIASKYSDKNNFIYADLYAGMGKFSDEELGSPLLAFNTIINSDCAASFHQITCFFTEQDETHVQSLYENLSTSAKQAKSLNVKARVGQGEWSEFSEKLQELLHYSTWGFIFIDPFSNEVELDQLFELLSTKRNMKDFMIFINVQSMKRIVGQNNYNEKVAKFLGVSTNDLLNIVKCDNKIREAMQQRFAALNKDYVINAAIPKTRNNKLSHTDNYQLLLATNSIGVADAFLKSHVEALIEFKGEDTLDLFETLEGNISQIVKDAGDKISIKSIFEKLYANHNSWKNADLYNIPTCKNIQKKINTLILRKILYIDADPQFFAKDGTLIIKAFQKNEHSKNIFVSGRQ